MKKCPVSDYCGGCTYQGIDYSRQLEMKQERVDELLSSSHHVEPIIGCKEPLHYRNKVQMSFGYDEDHKIICGYYLQNSHFIVPVGSCMIADEKMAQIFSSIRKAVIRTHTSVYDERTKKGSLRHALIRSSNFGEYMVVFVMTSPNMQKAKLLSEEILKYDRSISTVILNINKIATSLVLGPDNIVLYGKGYISDELCGLRFRISPSSFYQVNRYQTQTLYETAIKAAHLKKEDILIDAYCGTGTIGLAASKYVKKVYGVETSRSSIRDAIINKKINEIDNTEFVCEDAGRYMESLAAKKTHIDAVIMDPPRGGSDVRFMSSMVKMRPDRIVYVSCNPVTLKRDLDYLSKHYDIRTIQPVDMFPFTDHVESVVELVRSGL